MLSKEIQQVGIIGSRAGMHIATNETTCEEHMHAVARVVQVLRERVREVLSLDDMADIACLSPYYFSRVFHGIVGIPPGEFFSALRLEEAKRLLLTTDMSVTDICFEIGYSGLGSFTTRFTQLVGLSPRLLRHKARGVALSSSTTLYEPEPEVRAVSLPTHGLSGSIDAAEPFQGCIFVGLFPKPIPQGQPVRCTQLASSGPFHIDHIPDGRYYLLTAAFPLSLNPQTYLLPDGMVQVGVAGPLLISNNAASEPVRVQLRPMRLTDPPIITALS